MTTLVENQTITDHYTLYHGDSCQVIQGLPDCSVDFGIHSPPFSSLYIYSDSECDLGNSADDDEFFRHYEYLISEMYRITVTGRLCAVHCKDLPKYAGTHGTAGLRDFPGQIIQAFERHGWSYHSRITIWKCPVTERERTNNNGLLLKTATRDRSQLRQGMADYLLVFRKPPENTLVSDKPITWCPHCNSPRVEYVKVKNGTKLQCEACGEQSKNGSEKAFQQYIGNTDPRKHNEHPSKFARKSKSDTKASIRIWQRYAEPVWWDIDQTDVLNFKAGRSERDERHICLARDSLVLTHGDGHKPIQDVAIGDLVLTHTGRWMPVIAKQMTGYSDVVKVKAQGVEVRVTPTHRFWAKSSNDAKYHPKKAAMRSAPEWIEAVNLNGCYLNMKLSPDTYTDSDKLKWWMVGRWIADGHIDQRDVAHISCGADKLGSFLEMAGDYAGNPQKRTAYQVPLKDPGRVLRSILDECGKLAHGKHLPPIAFNLDKDTSSALLEGYLSGDGHYRPERNRWYATSVSRELLLGLKFLVQRVHGEVASIHAGRKPGTTTIEGRTVNTRQEWVLSWSGTSHSFSFVDDDGAWQKVKSVEPDGQSETWNLRVAEDASYTAEGCVVKNCPLQVCLIERSVQMWSSPGEVVFSPFAGVGSEGVGAIRQGRRFVGIELKDSYYRQAIKELNAAVEKQNQGSLFA